MLVMTNGHSLSLAALEALQLALIDAMRESEKICSVHRGRAKWGGFDEAEARAEFQAIQHRKANFFFTTEGFVACAQLEDALMVACCALDRLIYEPRPTVLYSLHDCFGESCFTSPEGLTALQKMNDPVPQALETLGIRSPRCLGKFLAAVADSHPSSHDDSLFGVLVESVGAERDGLLWHVHQRTAREWHAARRGSSDKTRI